MSLNLKPIQTVSVLDPRTDLHEKKWAILKGAKEVTYIPLTTTNISSSSLVYNAKPPSVKVFMNKFLYHRVPIRIKLTSSAPNANNLLRAGYDAPRQFPVTSSLSSLNVSFNGTSVSVNIGDYLHALMHYNTDEALKSREYSTGFSYADQSQEYNDLVGSVRNPLGSYSDHYAD